MVPQVYTDINMVGLLSRANIDVGPGHQIKASSGDIVLCHHQLPHRAAVNVSPYIRMAVYFRIYHKALSFEHPFSCALRQFSLKNVWSIGWRIEEKQNDCEDIVCACDQDTNVYGRCLLYFVITGFALSVYFGLLSRF